MEKVKNNITELVFILDRSGSMAGLCKCFFSSIRLQQVLLSLTVIFGFAECYLLREF